MKYAIGDKFWRVGKLYNRLRGSQNKIKMVDADGVEWYRYDKDTVEFDLHEAVILGTLEFVINGRSIWVDEEYLDRYVVSYDGNIEEAYEAQLDGDEYDDRVTYWHTKEEAEEFIKEERQRYAG